MDLIKKVAEALLVTSPLWISVGGIVTESLLRPSKNVVEYIPDSFSHAFRVRYGEDFVGPLPCEAMREITYRVRKNSSRTEVAYGHGRAISGTQLFDFDQDGVIDLNKMWVVAPRAGGCLFINRPITAADQALFTRIVAKAYQ